MATKNTKTVVVARNVVADLLGDEPVKGKVTASKSPSANAASRKSAAKNAVKAIKAAAKGKATPAAKGKATPAAKVGRPSKFQPTMKIKVVKERECRDGTPVQKVWEMAKSSKTVADFIAKRKRANMDGELGGYFPMFVNEKCIRVSA